MAKAKAEGDDLNMDKVTFSKCSNFSSVKAEVLIDLEAIFPNHGPDKIKRCIDLFKDTFTFIMNFHATHVMRWCIDRLLADNFDLESSDSGSNMFDVKKNQSSPEVKKTGCDEESELSVSGFEPPTDVLITRTEPACEVKILDKDPSVDNNQCGRSAKINQSEISHFSGGIDILQAGTGLGCDKNIVRGANSDDLVTHPKIVATGSNSGFLKSVSNSFDVSRTDMYTSTILDSSESDESRDSVHSITHSPGSDDELPDISFRKTPREIGAALAAPKFTNTSSASNESIQKIPCQMGACLAAPKFTNTSSASNESIQKIPRQMGACLAAPKFTNTSSASSCDSPTMSWRSSSKQTAPITSTVSTTYSSISCTSTQSGSKSSSSSSSSSQFSSFKLSPAKFSCSQSFPITVASTSDLKSGANSIPPVAVSTVSSIPVISNTSSTSRSPSHLQQTVTIQSTHQITYNPLMHEKLHENGFASDVKTEFTAPTPNITVQLSQPVDTSGRQQRPRPTLNDLLDRKVPDLKYAICEGCKAYYDRELLTSHKTKCEHLVTTLPKRLMGEAGKAAQRNVNTLDQDKSGMAMLGNTSLGKSDLHEGRIYFVSDDYGNGQRMVCLNNNLVSHGSRDAQVFGKHTFIEGRCYHVSSMPGEHHQMVWSKGKLIPKSDSTRPPRGHAARDIYKQAVHEDYHKFRKSLMTDQESTNKIGLYENAAEKTVPVTNQHLFHPLSYTPTDDEIDINDITDVKTNKRNGPLYHQRYVLLDNEDETINLDDVETINDDDGLDLNLDHNSVEPHVQEVIHIHDEAAKTETVDAVTKVRNEVLELFPDVEPTHLDSLCLFNTGPMAVNNICLQLLDSNYPKNVTSAAKIISESQPVEKKASPVDYFTTCPDIQQKNKARYNDEVFHKLAQEFLWIPVTDIRFVLSVKGNYAAAHKMMQEIWDYPSKIAKKSPSYKKHALSQLVFKCELEYHKGQKATREIKLLKNRRPVIKLGTDVVPELAEEIKFVEQKLKESAVEEDYKMACDMNEQEYEMEGQSIECGCCYIECQFERMVQCYEGHLFCESCLSQYAREAVFGQGKADLKCMTSLCESAFPKSQLKKALSSDVLSKYEDRVTEENINLADLGDLVQCPSCEFRACLDPNARVFSCQNPECKKESCRYCKVEWSEHFGKKCSEVEKRDETKLRLEYEEKMTKAKVRVCHRCKAQFTKEDGCNKMTCRCGGKQCYICRKPDIDYNHFCRHPRDPGKLCTTCKDCSLWTNPDEDDDRAVAEIQKEAEMERKKKGFTSDTVVGVPEEPPSKKQKTS